MSLATMTGAALIRTGATRRVMLIGRYAIKVPNVAYGWRPFLCGLLANMQEAEFSRAGLEGVCSVTISVPGGWLNIMKRAEMLTEEEWGEFCPEDFCRRADYMIPAEMKIDSFGKIGGEIVAIDYGN